MHSPKMWAMKMLVFGIVIILVRLYTEWDIWIVLGVLAIIKGIMLFAIPNCCCHNKEQAEVKKRRR